jgi:hypothetical protein
MATQIVMVVRLVEGVLHQVTVSVKSGAAARRLHATQRALVCGLMNAPPDSCYTVGELIRDYRNEGRPWMGPS